MIEIIENKRIKKKEISNKKKKQSKLRNEK